MPASCLTLLSHKQHYTSQTKKHRWGGASFAATGGSRVRGAAKQTFLNEKLSIFSVQQILNKGKFNWCDFLILNNFCLRQPSLINTFTAIVDVSRFNNSCLKSPVSTLVDLTFQSRALRSFSLNQLRNLSL